MPRAWSSGVLDEKLAIWANRLKAVMLQDDRLSYKQSKKKRCQRGACNMDDIGSAYQIPQLDQSWPADDTKRKRRVVKSIRGRLRDEHEIKFRIAVGRAKFRETPSERQYNGFDTANAWCEEMGIKKNFHS